MTRDARPTLHQPPPFAACRALLVSMSNPPRDPIGERERCPGHRWLADTIAGGRCDELTTPAPIRPPLATGLCLLRARARSRRVADYLHAKTWRANEVTIGPTGYRNRAMFEMLAHGVTCRWRQTAGLEPSCNCPPGYAEWWHNLPAPHPVVRYWEHIPPEAWPPADEGRAIADQLAYT